MVAESFGSKSFPYCCFCRRIYVTVVAGAVVGILGMEGIMGFIIYLICQLLVSFFSIGK